MQKGHLEKMVRCGAHVQKLANISKNDVSILWQKKKMCDLSANYSSLGF